MIRTHLLLIGVIALIVVVSIAIKVAVSAAIYKGQDAYYKAQARKQEEQQIRQANANVNHTPPVMNGIQNKEEPSAYRFCDYCGKKMPYSAQFCPNCGSKMEDM